MKVLYEKVRKVGREINSCDSQIKSGAWRALLVTGALWLGGYLAVPNGDYERLDEEKVISLRENYRGLTDDFS